MRKMDKKIFCGDSKGHLNIFNWAVIYEEFVENGTVRTLSDSTRLSKDSFENFLICSMNIGCGDINDILVMNNGEKIIVGCGNGAIASVDVEYNKKV